jgi:hypothetical protein
VAAIVLALAATAITRAAQKDDHETKSQHPKLTLKAQPAYGVAPARIVLSAELVGGSGDVEDYYCPAVRWEWGDDTSSESSADCPPYEEGKTELKRKFTIEHTFKRPGAFKVYFRLKHKDKEVAVTSALVQIQPGAEDLSR